MQTKPKYAYYDSLTVFSVIACFRRYVSEYLTDRENEETVKTAYFRGKAIAEDEIALLGAVTERGVSVPCID